MTELAIIGDVHGNRQRLAGVLELLADRRTDLVVLVGDLGLDPPWMWPARERERAAHDASVREVIDTVRRALACPVAFVPGNHDLRRTADGIEGVNCDGRGADVAGLRIVGLGGSGPASFGFPYEWREAEARSVLAPLFDRTVDIFLSHTPPADTGLDRTSRGLHVGSSAVRERIARSRPRLFLCGHIHEAWGVERLSGVPCLNAGALGEPCGQEIAWRVRWSDGPRHIRSLQRDAQRGVVLRDWLEDPA